MKINGMGQVGFTQLELAQMIRKEPTLCIDQAQLLDSDIFNQAIQSMYSDMKPLSQWQDCATDMNYHQQLQSQWLIPENYANVDIAELLLNRCESPDELQRMAQELFLFQEYGLFDLLKYLHFLVETVNREGIVMGVGRGSSVASFALYKLGVHRVNSLYYDLDISEFLR
jgi:DNA polymerase III alpha subunit